MTNYVDMYGWTIRAERFSAPIREGFHYFGSYAGETYSGPHNTAEDVWTEILEIRAEVRPAYADCESARIRGVRFGSGSGDAKQEYALEIERATIIATALRISRPNDGALVAEMSYNGPGKFEGTNDRALVVALYELSLHGCEDDRAGSTEYGLALQRFGRYVLIEDDRGFVAFERFDTDELAQSELDAEDMHQNPEEYAEES